MIEYRLVAELRADLDIRGAYLWYQSQRPGLGAQFLSELRGCMRESSTALSNIKSSELESVAPYFAASYAVYFAPDAEVIVVVAVLHVSRNPAEWQRRRP